ncbi:hypothetical protein [Rhodococcus sp. BS-15]|uniref:hypothetical protein n=1 Tax=Rhodococcus sp. BS-15 TaxID=1304954 RepID=UPI000A58A538|nr:hypothetical protein [Rhodococcus sp. BS-15]
MTVQSPNPELQPILDELVRIAPLAAEKYAERRAAEKARNDAILDAYLAGAKNRDLAQIVQVKPPRITALVQRGHKQRLEAEQAEAAQPIVGTYSDATDRRSGSAA